jgi:subtilase family serine protease
MKTAITALMALAPFALATLAVTATQGCTAANPLDGSSASSSQAIGQDGQQEMGFRPLCAETNTPHHAACRSWVRIDKSTGKIHAQAASAGPVAGTYGPPDLISAYALPTTGGAGVTVALVDAQDDPNAEADLGVYRAQFGLPPCTTSNGCFKKIDQNGGTSYPTEDDGWSGEISLDLDMVSAACPSCNILLVEATSADDSDLNAAIAQAATQGAKAISNSWSGPEDSTVSSEETAYDIPGVTVLAASGDDGFSEGTQFPASSQYVVAVGGTELDRTTSGRGWNEIVWGTTDPADDGATGSGCSAFITKPSWQHDTGCSLRMSNDVAAVADVIPGLAVYDTENAQGSGEGTGWVQIGGTSAATPLVAAILAVTGNAGVTPQFFYQGNSLNDVTSGNNGTCSTPYFCNAAVGYDGPSGMGTPIASGWNGSTPPSDDAGSPPPPPPSDDAGAPSDDAGAPPSTGAIVNGGFEDGNFTGWTTFGASEHVVSTGCHSGNYCAQVGSRTSTHGPSNVAQTFTAPAGSSQISIWYSESCPGSVSSEWATAALTDNTTGVTHKILAKTCVTTGWKNATRAIVAGHSYTVTLSVNDDASPSDPQWALYDDITVQ